MFTVDSQIILETSLFSLQLLLFLLFFSFTYHWRPSLPLNVLLHTPAGLLSVILLPLTLLFILFFPPPPPYPTPPTYPPSSPFTTAGKEGDEEDCPQQKMTASASRDPLSPVQLPDSPSTNIFTILQQKRPQKRKLGADGNNGSAQQQSSSSSVATVNPVKAPSGGKGNDKKEKVMAVHASRGPSWVNYLDGMTELESLDGPLGWYTKRKIHAVPVRSCARLLG